MKPNNLILTMLAAICDRLLKSGGLPPDASKQARELHDEWQVLVLRDNSGGAELQRQIEAQGEKLAAEMVKLIEKQLECA